MGANAVVAVSVGSEVAAGDVVVGAAVAGAAVPGAAVVCVCVGVGGVGVVGTGAVTGVASVVAVGVVGLVAGLSAWAIGSASASDTPTAPAMGATRADLSMLFLMTRAGGKIFPSRA